MLDDNYFEKRILIGLTIVWLVIHVLLFKYYGIRNLFDAVGYVKGADFLIQHGRLIDIHHFFYVVLVGLIAFFRILFPNEILPYLIFQCLISGLATLALYKTASKIFNNRLAGIFSSLIFLFWFDAIKWNMVTMTESLMTSITCFILFCITHFKGSKKEYFRIIILLTTLVFIRPTGVIIIFATVIFLIGYNWKHLKNRLVSKFIVIAGVSIICIGGATLLFTHWDFTSEYENGNIVTYMNKNEGTELYYESLRMQSDDIDLAKPETPSILKVVHFILHNPYYALKTGSLKVWYLVSFIRPYHSKRHNVYTIAWLMLVYTAFYFGFKNVQAAPIRLFVLIVIIANCSLIAIATVDWDNRFFMPMEPGIVLLAGGGVSYFYNKLRRYIFSEEQK